MGIYSIETNRSVYCLNILASFVIILLLSGCVGKKKVTFIPRDNSHKPRPIKHCSVGTPADNVEAKLGEQYTRWRGVKYRSGGVSRSGIDCSAFVQRTYHDLFHKDLPRTVQEQAACGRQVLRESLQPGDLVFFKTGIYQKHVGIYIGKGAFMHVTVSKGLTVSHLESSYWSGRYWKGKRLL